MLTPPDISEQDILDCLRVEFGIAAERLTFLPLGVDAGTAVWRADSKDGAWFVKLRQGFEPLSVEVPAWLGAQGVGHLIQPVRTTGGGLWAELGERTVVVYPFVNGQDGYERALTEAQWRAFGATVRAVHDCPLLEELRGRVAVEGWSPVWRERLAGWMLRVDENGWRDSEAEACSALMREHLQAVMDTLAEAEKLNPAGKVLDFPPALCHTDLHPGNLHITEDEFYIVDWDAPLLAPRERDLMSIGAGQSFAGMTAEEEMRWFYAGYGVVDINDDLRRYCCLARMIEDMALFCDDLLGGAAQGADRAASLRYLKGIVESINRKDAKAAKKINK